MSGFDELSVIPGFRHFALLLASAVILRLLYQHWTDPLRDIPGPWIARYTRLWLWREYRKGQFHRKNVDLHRQYGPVVRIAPKEYSIDDPNALRIIYGHGTKFIKGPWYLASGPPSQHTGVVNIFSDRNPRRHAESRRKVAHIYSLTALLEMEQYVDSTTAIFMQHLENFATTAKVFDMGHWLQCYAFDVIGEITFARRFGFLDEGKDIGDIMKNLEKGLRRTAPLGVYYELNPAYRYLRGFMDRLLRRTDGRAAVFAFTQAQILLCSQGKSDSQRRDFLTRLMDIHRVSPATVTQEEIFVICLTQITAGSDTTAISLRAVLYYLYRNPRTLSALRAEISEMVAAGKLSEPVTYRQSLQMPYLQAVLKEALRMHPATGLPLGREVPEGGATVCGRFFPAGTVVGVNSWVAHANKGVFGSDADQFRPERWLVEKQEYAVLDQYFLSFGLGSRTCIGKNISLMEMSKLIPQIVRHYDIKFERSEWEMEDIWFVKQSGLSCTLRKIEPQSSLASAKLQGGD